jgi:hypothetical protein
MNLVKGYGEFGDRYSEVMVFGLAGGIGAFDYGSILKFPASGCGSLITPPSIRCARNWILLPVPAPASSSRRMVTSIRPPAFTSMMLAFPSTGCDCSTATVTVS